MAVAYHDVSAERNPSPEAVYIRTINRALSAGGPVALAIYVHLNEGAEHGIAAASNTTLQEVAEASEQTVRRKIQTLVEAGLVEVIRPGNGRGNIPVYRLVSTVITHDIKGSIVNDFTQKGAKHPNKGCQTWYPLPDKGYQATPERVPTTPIKGANDTNPTSTSSSSSNYINKITTTNLTPAREPVETAQPDERDLSQLHFLNSTRLFYGPKVQRTIELLNIRMAVAYRSIRAWQEQSTIDDNLPTTPQEADRRVAAWLKSGENKGIHKQWIVDNPMEMGGVAPK